MARQWLIFAPILLHLAAFSQSRGAAERPTFCQVTVKVTGDDSRPFNSPVRVQLLSNTRTPIAETFTRDDGTAVFPAVTASDYMVRVTSPDIEEASASFTIYPRQAVHTEYVAVRLKEASSKTSNETSVSAASLNIPKKASKELAKGIEALDENRTAEAATHISKAIEAYPRFPAAWNAQGVIAMKSDDREKARTDFEKAIEFDGNFIQAYINLAKLQIREKKNTEALALLNKAISLDPRNANALLVLANLELTSGKYDDAIRHAQQVHALVHPNLSAAHLVAAMAFERKDEYANAVAEYKLFLEESPNSSSQDRVRAALESAEKHTH